MDVLEKGERGRVGLYKGRVVALDFSTFGFVASYLTCKTLVISPTEI